MTVVRAPFQVRGRYLALTDIGIMTMSMAFAWSVLGTALPLWEAAIVLSFRAGLLVRAREYHRARAYQHARSADAVGEFARLVLPFCAGSLVGYAVVLRESLIDAATARAAVADSAVALLLMILVRVGLAAVGAGRRVEVRASSDPAAALPRELEQMFEALGAASPVYRPSRFWEELNRRHLAYLASENGFGHFKRTVNTAYFQFGVSGFWASVPVLLVQWLRHPRFNVFAARMDGSVSGRGAATLIALYANAVANRPQGHLVGTIAEPPVGDPLTVRFGENAITEDLCHSIEEFDTVVSALPSTLPVRRALELGAGYGRLAYVWLRARPDVQYHIVDIPPALYLSQRYLQEVLPDLSTFTFRPFRDYAEVAEEMSRARLIFLEPQQLVLLPDDHIDIFMTVSTLHEMRLDQIAHYFVAAERLCRGAFYFKQWRYFYNDADATTLTRDTYPVPASWRLLLERTPLVPRAFFEALYLCRP